MPTPRHILALVLCCAGVMGLLAVVAGRQVSAQTIDCSSQSSDPDSPLIRDCETLLGLKDELDPSGRMNWAGNLALAEWHGIASGAGVISDAGVVRLNLGNKPLRGTIPATFASGDLPALQDLYLHNNRLTGSIPPELGNLTALQNLYLSNNELTGSIPAALGDLTELENLDLHNNKLTGNIPMELGNLTTLQSLNLYSNRLTGSIPPELGGLTALQDLALSDNQLTGSIPAELGDLENLEGLSLHSNQLTGSIPAELGGLENLRDMYLGDNNLSGAIPSELGNLENLEELSLHSNQLTGNIPPELGDLPALVFADLTCNMFTGTVPSGLVDKLKPEPPECIPAPPPGGDGGSSGGSSSSGSSGGGGSSAPAPPPVPTRSPLIGSTTAATAMELAGDRLVLQRHDQPGVEIEVGIGWISRDGQTVIAIGFVRDGDLGQTYAVVRREGDGQVVRRWIAPDSPLVYAVPWAEVNTQYTFPVGVILAIPLDEQYPWPHMLTRRFDGGDDRILAYDAVLGQWRHVPDLATFQARGYYWCNVTAADVGFFDRIELGPPYPASSAPARADYPVCQT